MFSGGADSALALDMAVRVCGVENVIAVHVHFIGQSTDKELTAAMAFASKLNVKTLVHRVVVGDNHKGPEGNARLEFKVVLQSILDDDTIEEVWLGHNRDDHIETVLIQLFRGAGAGTKGIPDKRQGKVYRPLIDMTREAIREECDERGIEWYSDPMNEDCSLTRAFFREKIIPQLKEHYGANGTYTRINTIAKKFKKFEQEKY